MRVFWGIIFLGLGFCAYGVHQPAMAGPKNVLDESRWHNRLVVTCSKRDLFKSNTFASDYMDTIDPDGFMDRDIMLLQILKKPRTGILAIILTPEPRLQLIRDPELTTMIAEKVECNGRENSIALIGKDGGLKKIWPHKAPSNQTLFEVIDAMPMRQMELRDRLKYAD